MDNAEIAAERGVAGQRQDFGAAPAAGCEELGRVSGRNHRGGHRPSHDAGTLAVKRRAPSSANSSGKSKRLRPAVSAGLFGPFDQQHALGRAIQAELVELADCVDPVEIDVPDRRVELVIGLDDGEAWAWHLPSWPSAVSSPRASAVLPTPSGPERVDDVARAQRVGEHRAQTLRSPPRRARIISCRAGWSGSPSCPCPSSIPARPCRHGPRRTGA